MAGGSGGMPDMSRFLSDPDVKEAMLDPELCAAYEDIKSNPSNFLKYQNNPKVKKFVEKMAAKMGFPPGGFTGAGGFPGGFPGAEEKKPKP